jgi:hypothetical protein
MNFGIKIFSEKIFLEWNNWVQKIRINEIKSDQSAAATRPTQPLSSATHTTLNMLNKFNTSLLQLIPQLHPQHHYTQRRSQESFGAWARLNLNILRRFEL